MAEFPTSKVWKVEVTLSRKEAPSGPDVPETTTPHLHHSINLGAKWHEKAPATASDLARLLQTSTLTADVDTKSERAESCAAISNASSPARSISPTMVQGKGPLSPSRRTLGVSVEDRDVRKKRKRSPEEDRRRLKCPYYLNKPERHRRGSCRGEGFADMGKLKDHLKRVHQKPRQCPRCWKELVIGELYEKHKLEANCQKRDKPEDDRVTAEKLRNLNFSRVPYAHRTVEDKWRRLYKDLFPTESEENIPSPYEEYGLGPGFDNVLARRLAQEFADELAGRIDETKRETLQERLLGVIRECKRIGSCDPVDLTKTKEFHILRDDTSEPPS